MRVGFSLQATLPCSACQTAIPVPGLVESCSCPKCGVRALLPPHLWRSLFSEAAFAEAATCEEGDGLSVDDEESGSSVVYGRRQPRCPRCKLDIPVDALDQAARMGQHACACGERVRVREADALARALLPSARFVVRESFPDAPAASARAFILVAELSESELDEMRAQAEDGPGVAAASNPETAPDTLRALARSEDWNVRAGVARNPSTPTEVLARLVEDDDSDVLEALAENPALDARLCELLCGHDDYDVRRLAVVHPRASLAVVRRLLEAGESDSDVLKAIATRPDADLAMLARLSLNGDDEVGAAIAVHPAADEALLVALAGRNDSDVCRALLRRKELPLSVLRALVADDAPVTEERVKAHASYPLLAAYQRRVNLAIGAGVLVLVLLSAGMALLFPTTE